VVNRREKTARLCATVMLLFAGVSASCRTHAGLGIERGDSATKCPPAPNTAFSIIDESDITRQFIAGEGIAVDHFWKIPERDSGCIVAAFVRYVETLKASEKDREDANLIAERESEYFFECVGIVSREQRQYFCNVVDPRNGRGPRSDRFTCVGGGGMKVLLMLFGPTFQVLKFSTNGDI
jgi:hypothetical protein